MLGGIKLLRKDITFIYMDAAEQALFSPIVEEAINRGYKVKLTNNKFEKCEIGIYCQHVNFPQFSKFSVIMLHDIIQQYSNWPDVWYREPWNKYDIGVLPSKQWENNWNKCSQFYYTRPRIGMFKIGWPKADILAKYNFENIKKNFNDEYHLDNKKRTILYAPAWENDGKQDDFVKAMMLLDVNILIKQAKWVENDYPHIVKNIKEMYHLHKDNKRVTILPPETNIFDAIVVSDVLVSEESSTMCEAVMLGKPAVSVSDWLIPDTIPSRFPKCDYDFVIETKKDNLIKCISEIIDNYDKVKQKFEVYAKENFGNIGSTSSMIMDIIDDCVNGNNIRYKALEANKSQKMLLNRWLKHLFGVVRREMALNYAVRYKIIRHLWNGLRIIKHMAIRK